MHNLPCFFARFTCLSRAYFRSFISGIKLPGANNFVLFSGDPGSPIIEMLLSLE